MFTEDCCGSEEPKVKKKKKYVYPNYKSESSRYKKANVIKAKCPKCEKIHSFKTEIPPENDMEIKRRNSGFMRKFCPKCQYGHDKPLEMSAMEHEEYLYDTVLLFSKPLFGKKKIATSIDEYLI